MAKLVAGTRVVSSAEASSLAPDDIGEALPEAGYERDEELRHRCDALEAQIATLTDAKNGGVERQAFDLSKVEKDNEILQFIEQGSYPVTKADNDCYIYCWVNRDLHGKFGGVHIYRKKAQGYEMCRYGDPEEAGMKSPEGYCVIGDVVLMRITRDRHLILHQRQQKITDLRRKAGEDELRQVGDRARSKGIAVTIEGELDDAKLAKMEKNAEAERRAKAITDKWMKAGRMPGVPGPSASRN